MKIYKVKVKTFGGMIKIHRVLAKSTSNAIKKVEKKYRWDPIGKTVKQINNLQRKTPKTISIINS